LNRPAAELDDPLLLLEEELPVLLEEVSGAGLGAGARARVAAALPVVVPLPVLAPPPKSVCT